MKNEIVESLAASPPPRKHGGIYEQAFKNVEALRARAAAKVDLLETIVAAKSKPSASTPVAAPVAAPGKVVTAATFAASTASPRMATSEFAKLSQTDRAKYIAAGGTLFDEVATPVAKSHPSSRKRNSVWIADFNKMSALQKFKHIAAGGNLHD